MAKVDSKGRIVLPQEVRDRLGITPGTEVEVHEEDGRAVVEPEDDPGQVIERLERLVEETAPPRGERMSLDAGVDPIAQKHRDAVRRGADRSDSSDGGRRASASGATRASSDDRRESSDGDE